jgi:hypothetical protein
VEDVGSLCRLIHRCEPSANCRGVWAHREKLQACEGKLRAAIQDKNNVGLEKAGLERELKGLRGQAGKLTKVVYSCFVEKEQH